MLWLLIGVVHPCWDQPLPQKCDRIDRYEQIVFATGRFSRSVTALPDTGAATVYQLTDDADLVIEDFQATPFVLLLSTGRVLLKYTMTTGRLDTIIRAGRMTAFTLTAEGDLVIADRDRQTLEFFDFRGRSLFSVPRLATVKDLAWAGGVLYALGGSTIDLYDRHGNGTGAIETPEPMERMRALDSLLLLFTPGLRYGYARTSTWQRFDVPYPLSDIAVDDSMIIILGDLGAHLYYYQRTGFGER